jgi:hypothetical protein
MTIQESVIAHLKTIEKKHADFFIAANLKIMDCVIIKGTDLVSVHVINNDLPTEIEYEIEEMFWVD